MLDKHTQLVLTLLAATLSACDVNENSATGSPPAELSPGSGGRVGIEIVATGSGGQPSEPPVTGDFSCVPKEFRLSEYQAGGPESAGGAGGAAGTPAIDPATLKVGDGDLSVLVVFDRSGSMSAAWGGTTRFWAAHDALMRGIHHYIDNVTVAALRFPVDDSCGTAGLHDPHQVDWAQGFDFVQRWGNSVCGNLPRGSTPLFESLRVADETIEQAKLLGLLEDRFRVLVLTDGEETCDPLGNPVDYATKWAAEGVETHVVGLPGSENADAVLRAMALAGGGVYTAISGAVDAETGQGTLTGAIDTVIK